MLLKILLVLISLGWAESIQAADSSAKTLSLVNILQAVRSGNPDLAAARSDARMGRQMATATYAWMPPRLDMELMGMAWPDPNLGQTMERRLGLTQELPFPGRTWLKGRAASFVADVRAAESEMLVQQKLKEARETYFELAASERLLLGLDRTSEATQEMTKASARRASFGQLDRMGQFMDTMLAMEENDVASMRPMAEQRRAMAEAHLNRLMGVDPMTKLPPVELNLENFLAEPVPSLEELMVLAEQHGPELKMAQAKLQAAAATRTVAYSAWLPDLMVSGSVKEDVMGQRQSSAMLGVSLPWLWFWQQASEAGAANSGMEMAQQQLNSTRLKQREDMRNALGELKSVLAALKISVTRTYPKAVHGLELARSGFKTTALGPSEVLMAVQNYRMMEEKLSQLIAQLGQARAMLDMLTASQLADGSHAVEANHE